MTEDNSGMATTDLYLTDISSAGKANGRKLALASMVGTSLEWYDFMIYNTGAALVFGSVFFPASTPLVGALLAFSTYAVGYLSRPLGGIVFGRLGDLLGRRAVLMLTLILMGLTTSLIAILPSYQSIGIWSPVALVCLRLLQGTALGGEWAGAVLLSVEHGRRERRGLNASWAQVGPAAGTLLSSAVIGLTTFLMPDAQFMAWGWRIPFALSALLVVFGLWLRVGISETPTFEAMQARKEVVRAPVREILRHHRRPLLIAAVARIGPDVVYALLVVFSLTYITHRLGLPRSIGLSALMLGAAVNMVATPFFGLLTDRIGRRPVYALGLLAAVPVVVAFFPLLNTKSPVLLTLTIMGGLAAHAAMYAAQGAFITEQFAPPIRYTGSSVAYTFGSLAGGGAFAPLIMATLLETTGSTPTIVAYVLLALAATGTAVFFSDETSDVD